MVPECVPFKIVSDSPTLHSRWLLFFKVMSISLWNLLQYHSIVRWAIQAQWAEPLVWHKLGLLCIAREEKKIKETCTFLGGFPILSYFICIWSSWNVKTNKTNKNKNKISRIKIQVKFDFKVSDPPWLCTKRMFHRLMSIELKQMK